MATISRRIVVFARVDDDDVDARWSFPLVRQRLLSSQLKSQHQHQNQPTRLEQILKQAVIRVWFQIDVIASHLETVDCRPLRFVENENWMLNREIWFVVLLPFFQFCFVGMEA